MREIKFRVFDTTTHDMYFPGEDGSQLVIGMSHALEEDKNYVALWSEDGEICRTGQAEFMQCAGLKDKNGVEIYENDIIRVETFGFDPDLFTTEVIYKHAAFRLKNGRNMFYFGQTDMTVMDDAVVIGNRFENPELLEVQP